VKRQGLSPSKKEGATEVKNASSRSWNSSYLGWPEEKTVVMKVVSSREGEGEGSSTVGQFFSGYIDESPLEKLHHRPS